MTDHLLLSVSGLHKTYGNLHILKGISFCLDRGEVLAIIGPSGSGKSTCLRSINFLERPSAGEIILDGNLVGQIMLQRTARRPMSNQELAPQRAEIGMVFQEFHLWPHLTVRENVALQPRFIRGLSRRAANELADAMLLKVHLSQKADEYPEQLSGGQRQRVAIARTLAQKPKLILFDEPTSALDPELVGEVLGVIRELAAEGRSMVLVTHEIAFAREVADRIIFMADGLIVEEGPSRDVLMNPRSIQLRRFLSQTGLGGVQH